MTHINNTKTSIYCKKKKQDFERRIVTNSLAVQKLQSDIDELEPVISKIEFSNYEEAKDELDGIQNSAEYRSTTDPEHYLHKQVCKLQEECILLQKWEYKNNLLKDLKEEIEEDTMFLKDTEDVLERLKIQQEFLLK